LEIPLKESERKEIKLAGSTVDFGILENMKLKKVAINSQDADGLKVLYNGS
jgi:hypothetical protein